MPMGRPNTEVKVASVRGAANPLEWFAGIVFGQQGQISGTARNAVRLSDSELRSSRLIMQWCLPFLRQHAGTAASWLVARASRGSMNGAANAITSKMERILLKQLHLNTRGHLQAKGVGRQHSNRDERPQFPSTKARADGRLLQSRCFSCCIFPDLGGMLPSCIPILSFPLQISWLLTTAASPTDRLPR
jgi:hypothetical protein